ncbi:hypothetical protein EMCRGX_G024703 [Ephydatia muelleri]
MSVLFTKARSSHPPYLQPINDKAAAAGRQNPMELAGQFLHVDKCRYDWLEDTRNGVSLPFIEAMYSPSSNISNLVWKWSVILTQLLSSQPIIEKLKKEIPQYLSRARGRQHVRDLLNDSSNLLEPDVDSREDSYFELDYSGATAVSYCWAPVAGYSTFGKYAALRYIGRSSKFVMKSNKDNGTSITRIPIMPTCVTPFSKRLCFATAARIFVCINDKHLVVASAKRGRLVIAGVHTIFFSGNRYGYLSISSVVLINEIPGSRKLNDTAFTTLSPNGEKVVRNWLIYSPSTGCVFCFVCKLFSTISTSNSSGLATTGFDSWDHIGRRNDHERSVQHRESLSKYAIRLAKCETIDRCIIDSYARENSCWKEVLRRVVSVVTFLVTRGLALRGSNEVFGSVHNGNYLGCLELLAEYDPFLAQHIESLYGNSGRGNPSYLSSTICEKFVLLMAEEIKQVIINEITSAKYYSLSIDSTPDISHTDQLTFTVRYVHEDGMPTERFLKFEEIHSHTGLNLFNTIIEALKILS